MNLEKAIFYNRAPFEHLELNFKERGINVLIGINGKGKTTILSHIVDAFHEMARVAFPLSYEGKENKYYRISSSLNVINSNEPSIVFLRFKQDDAIYDYLDIRGKIEENTYNEILPNDIKINYSSVIDIINQRNNIKQLSSNATKEQITKIFNSSIITYFPSYRYEQPGYLNDPYKINLEFENELSYSDYLTNPIEVISDLPALANWLMDVSLDILLQQEELNNLNTELKPIIAQNNNTFDLSSFPIEIKRKLFLLSTYPSKPIFDSINSIITNVLLSKYPDMSFAIKIGERSSGGSRMQVVNINDNKNIIYPSIFNMSSGELSAFTLFIEILRQSDNIRKKISDVNGIVLVDEIENNLHIKLQKEVLPKLLNIFPNIQFIITSHSPFLNMGLEEQAKDRSQIIDLDNDGLTCEPTNNEQYKQVYDMMINENNRFAEKYKDVERQIKSFQKTIVITEGKTDIIHILKAKEKLNINDIDFDRIEIENQPNGEGELKTLLEKLSKVRRNNKIIGIFDRDVETTVNNIEKDNQDYKSFGNNVYAFCIVTPQDRINNGQNKISIEYFYSDDEIKTMLPNGRRLFFGNEFTKNSMIHNTNGSLSLKTPKGKGEDKIIENNGGQAVFNENDDNILAKKIDFANAIADNTIEINENSWQNFIPIFVKLKKIINL